MNILKKVYYLIDIMYKMIIVIFGELALFLMACGVFFEVISRYFFGISHGMISENLVLLYLLAVFLSAGLVTNKEQNVRLTLFSDRVERNPNENFKRIYKIILSVIEVVFALIMIYVGIIDTIIKFSSRATSIFSYVIPYWICYLSLSVGMFFVLIYKIKQIVELFTNISYRISRGGESK